MNAAAKIMVEKAIKFLEDMGRWTRKVLFPLKQYLPAPDGITTDAAAGITACGSSRPVENLKSQNCFRNASLGPDQWLKRCLRVFFVSQRTPNALGGPAAPETLPVAGICI
jgi:hypothetical protein